MGEDLVVENEYLYFKDYSGRKERVGVVYRRISDEYLDPITFNRASLIGVPHIFEIYKKGNVALINAPRNGATDDKGIYYDLSQVGGYNVVFVSKSSHNEHNKPLKNYCPRCD